ncbi:MAG: GNAT family N-acetyltransferase [Tepidisphaeraceae bacterium]
MQLNVVASSSTDLARVVLRCQEDLAQTLGEPIEIPGVSACVARDLPESSEANAVFLSEAVGAEGIRAIDAAFASAGARCLRGFSLVPQPALQEGGKWRERQLAVLRLSHWRASDADAPAITILQARAAFAQATRLFEDRFGPSDRARAAERALDNPKFEQLIAIESGVPRAAVGLLTRGEAACVMGHVPAALEQGIDRLLFDRIIDLAARANVRHVLAAIDVQDDALLRFYAGIGAGIGFERIGAAFEYTLA